MPALFGTEYLPFFIAIAVIAISLIATLIHELRKPKRDPNDDPDTKRINDMLKD